jgi:hypothetical protein
MGVMSNVQKDFRTSDLYFAAYLKALDIPLLSSAKVGKRTFFVFDKVEDIRDIKNEYFSGSGTVSALRHANEIRTLKRICHL